MSYTKWSIKGQFVCISYLLTLGKPEHRKSAQIERRFCCCLITRIVNYCSLSVKMLYLFQF